MLVPASLGLARMADAGFWRTQKERGRSFLASGTRVWSVIPDAGGAVGGEGPKATPGQPSASGLLPPPCSRDLKRDVAKKLEKLEKRTQRAIAELIRKCGAW